MLIENFLNLSHGSVSCDLFIIPFVSFQSTVFLNFFCRKLICLGRAECPTGYLKSAATLLMTNKQQKPPNPSSLTITLTKIFLPCFSSLLFTVFHTQNTYLCQCEEISPICQMRFGQTSWPHYRAGGKGNFSSS